MCYGRTLLRDGFGKLAASGPSCLPAALALGLQVRGTNRDTGRGPDPPHSALQRGIGLV
jgi:hypothetical protein